jgi:hypothetical protein
MSLLYSNVLTREVEQSIPAQLRFKREANEDVIVSRMKWRVNTMSSATEYGSGVGNNAGIQKLMTFKILSENWLDPQSLRLTGKIVTGGDGLVSGNLFTDPLNQVYLLPQGDGVDSVFRSVRTSINSREFEFIDNYNVLFPNLLTVASCPSDTYNTAGTFQGNWIYLNKSSNVYNTPAVAPATDDATTQALATATLRNVFNNELYIVKNLVDGYDFSIPLHCGLFRTGQFIPPRVSIEIEITMEDIARAFEVVRGTTPPAAPTNYYYKIQNPTILVDQITVHPSYNEKYNEVINSKGLALETDVYACVTNPVPAASSMMFNINRGVSRLRSMYSVMVDPTVTSLGLANFISNHFKNFKATINGISYPSSDGIEGFAQAFDVLQQSLGQLNDYNASSLLDYNKYANKDNGWRAGNNETNAFILGLDFQKSDSRASGTDTAVTGGVINLQLNATANMTAGQMLTFLHFDRGMLIKSDGIVLSE